MRPRCGTTSRGGRLATIVITWRSPGGGRRSGRIWRRRGGTLVDWGGGVRACRGLRADGGAWGRTGWVLAEGGRHPPPRRMVPVRIEILALIQTGTMRRGG